MAKFKNLDLILNKGEKAIFNGTGGDSYFTYSTISGYNTPSGVIPITPVDELVVSVPVAGERAIEPYHLVRYDQLVSSMSEINPLDWQESALGFTGDPTASGTPQIGDRWVVGSPATGNPGTGPFAGHDNEVAEWNGTAWVFQPPNEGFTLRDEGRDQFYTFDGTTWGLFAATVDHSALSGLDTDDHEQYILVDGSRGFTGTVSGVYPQADDDLATKEYVDEVAAQITGGGGVVTLTGVQTIDGDKTFGAGTLTTFLGDVFFDGINITMSGTTLNTQSGATFNYDSTSTTNNSGATNYSSTATVTISGAVTYGDGSSETHESGSTETYETGSNTVHDSGSNDTYNDGANVTYSGANIVNQGDTSVTYEDNSSVTYGTGTSETHESGSTETYESGSTVTVSGAMVYGDGSTETHETGSSETHETGSTDTYESGSNTVHEGGSNDTYNDGANLTFSGTNINYEGDTNVTVNSGTTFTFNDGSTINNNGDTVYGDTSTVTYSGSDITYEGDTNITVNSGTTTNYNDGSVNNYNDGAVNNYNDGSETNYNDNSSVTYSGANVSYEGDTNITLSSGTTTTYEDGSTINNNGDNYYGGDSTTVFEQGSEVTFSGTTTFETPTYFNNDIIMASGTSLSIGDLVITGTISGSFTDTNRRFGQEPVINGATSQAVVFATPFADDSYTLVATLTNEVDSPPSIYSTIQGVKASTGFTTYFSGVIDSSNFVLEWVAFFGQQE